MSATEAARFAARWWRDALAGPRDPAADVPLDLAVERPAVANVLEKTLRILRKKPIEPEILDAFEREIERFVVEKIDSFGHRCVCLHVDYDPWWDLADICKRVGVPDHRLPYKTVMDVTPDVVEVRQDGEKSVVWRRPTAGVES